MPYAPTLGSCVLLAAASLLATRTSAPPAANAPGPQDPPAGHLVLVVEGDVRSLSITHAAAKPASWGGGVKGLKSPFMLRLLDAKGAELLAIPVDLSAFDTDPTRIGKPLVVQGCVVRDWRIGTLLNVPDLPQVSRYVFTRDGVEIGATSAATVARLLGESR